MHDRHTGSSHISIDSSPPTIVDSNRERWNQEYRNHKAIPSSCRTAPSKALLAAGSAINYSEIGTIVDVGCGNGRNAVYLADLGLDVIAIDFASEAIDMTQAQIERTDISGSIDLIQCDVREGIPVQDCTVDLVIDSYTSCHFLDDQRLKQYLCNVEQILRPGGQLYWSALSPDDEYYSQLTDTHPESGVIVDPLNDIPKRLYSQEMIRQELPTNLAIELMIELCFTDTVDETEYWRAIVASVFEK